MKNPDVKNPPQLDWAWRDCTFILDGWWNNMISGKTLKPSATWRTFLTLEKTPIKLTHGLMTRSNMWFTSWLSPSLSPITHIRFTFRLTRAGTAYRSQTHVFIYIKVWFTSFPQTFFFLTGAGSRHIPDVLITFHSWIHLNLPLPLSFLFNTDCLCCFISPHVELQNKYPVSSHRTHNPDTDSRHTAYIQYKLVLPWMRAVNSFNNLQKNVLDCKCIPRPAEWAFKSH